MDINQTKKNLRPNGEKKILVTQGSQPQSPQPFIWFAAQCDTEPTDRLAALSRCRHIGGKRSNGNCPGDDGEVRLQGLPNRRKESAGGLAVGRVKLRPVPSYIYTQSPPTHPTTHPPTNACAHGHTHIHTQTDIHLHARPHIQSSTNQPGHPRMHTHTSTQTNRHTDSGTQTYARIYPACWDLVSTRGRLAKGGT